MNKLEKISMYAVMTTMSIIGIFIVVVWIAHLLGLDFNPHHVQAEAAIVLSAFSLSSVVFIGATLFTKSGQ